MKTYHDVSHTYGALLDALIKVECLSLVDHYDELRQMVKEDVWEPNDPVERLMYQVIGTLRVEALKLAEKYGA